ncbi:AlbA family DNA-binding domain-containing protein [Nonomuraea wenchangensis]|uniref:AlbA family DNA-binding domain-containing protein n=1 Tax=Nonomuraea wenchangensis TaxID=568860 RepID=UPI0033FC4521
MALNFDISSPPVRPADFVGLAEAIFQASAADESWWLEWKSTLDLTSKHGWHHIARAIIGFANRMPDQAERFTGGHAYFVAGICPGAADGIKPVDVVDLDKGLTPYLGDPGPRWRPTYVTVTLPTGTAQVLIIDVEPPRWGDPIFCMRKELGGVAEGTVFVRGNGATRPARAHEIDALGERLRRAAQQIEADVVVRAGAPVRPVDTSEQAVRQWLQTKERPAMESLLTWERSQQDKENPVRRSYLSGTSTGAHALSEVFGKGLVGQGLVRHIPEGRTPQKYREQVDAYLQHLADGWRQALLPGAAAHVTPIEFELHNLLTANLAEVEVRLYVPGNVHAVRPRTRASMAANDSFVKLPRPPQPYGPRTVSLLDGGIDSGLGSLARVSPSTTMPGNAPRPPRPHIDNGGSTTITFPAVHLRPHHRVRLDPIVLVIEAPAPAVVTAQWWATSTSMNGTAQGQLSIPIADEPLPLAVVLTEPDAWRQRRDKTS